MFWHFMQIVSYGDICMECQNPFFGKQNKKYMSSAELAQRMVIVNCKYLGEGSTGLMYLLKLWGCYTKHKNT